MGILAIPAMLFFFYGTELADSSFTKVVAAASLGNLGSSDPVCQDARYDLSSATADTENPRVSISLSCPFGELWAIKQFGQVSVSTPVDCEGATDDPDNASFDFYPPDCEYALFDTIDYDAFTDAFERQCKGKSDCQFSF